MTKKIGIVSKILGPTVGISAAYFDHFSKYGDVVQVNPTSKVLMNLDLLVLPGGPDLKMYDGAVPSARTGQPDVMLEYFDENALGLYIKAEVPILGICRGFQALNAFYHGSIVQHVAMKTSFPRDELMEEVILTDGSKFKVNSLHHQAIFPTDLSTKLVPLATSVKYGNIEAFSNPEQQMLGVQWHPEEVTDEDKYAYYFVHSAVSRMLGMEE